MAVFHSHNTYTDFMQDVLKRKHFHHLEVVLCNNLHTSYIGHHLFLHILDNARGSYTPQVSNRFNDDLMTSNEYHYQSSCQRLSEWRLSNSSSRSFQINVCVEVQ